MNQPLPPSLFSLSIILSFSSSLFLPLLIPDDVNNLVGKSEALNKLLGIVNHMVHHLPTSLGAGDTKLLYLLKLMNSEDTPRIPTVRSNLEEVVELFIQCQATHGS